MGNVTSKVLEKSLNYLFKKEYKPWHYIDPIALLLAALKTVPDKAQEKNNEWETRQCRNSVLMTHHYQDLGSASDRLKEIFGQSDTSIRSR